jgi:hypothetical protein
MSMIKYSVLKEKMKENECGWSKHLLHNDMTAFYFQKIVAQQIHGCKQVLSSSFAFLM